VIGGLQNQIDLYFNEINKLRSTQNSHVPVSGLPAELLSEVFLYIVESYLEDGGLRFAWGAFKFRQVCKRWNEVAVRFPQLWVHWAPGAFKVWDLFNARSKGAPISLTWRPRCTEASIYNKTMEDPTIPDRIRALDFNGTNDQLERLLSAFGSSHSSNASSIQLHITPYDEHGPRTHTTSFLSLPFPKLSKLDINNSLPDSSSPLFATSNLVSLRLGIPYHDKRCYTRSQFSKILQRHPNLRELYLWQGAMPQIEPSEPFIPVVLPRLVDLRLHGTEAIIAGCMDIVSMSSPLHNVFIDFESTSTTTVPALANTVKKILASYYECQELDYPRMADHLTVSLDSKQKSLVFNAVSRSTSASHPSSNLELRFSGTDKTLAGEICLLFPLDHVVEFAAIGLRLLRARYCEIFRKMEALLHLRLDKMDPGLVMGALSVDDQTERVYNKAAAETLLVYLRVCS